MTEYVINSILWAVGGFVLGYWVCSMRQEIKQVKKAIADRKHGQGEEGSLNGNRMLTIGVIVLALFVALFSAGSSIQRNNETQCQTDFNVKVVTAIKLQRDSLSEAIDAILSGQEAEQALRGYLQTVEDYPLPPLREANCD